LEDAQAFAENLLQEWGVDGVEAQSLSVLYVQRLLKTNRLHACEVSLIQSQMFSRGSRDDFALQAGIPADEVCEVPDWYFSDDEEAKRKALLRGGAVEEAARLAARYSLVQCLEAKSLLPKLWEELNEVTVGTRLGTLNEMLDLLYGQGSPQANLQAFIEDYTERFKYDLLWAKHWRRYEAHIAAIRARHVLNLTSKPEWVKVESLQHRRRAEITQQALFLSKGYRAQHAQGSHLIDEAASDSNEPIKIKADR
jgi:hypothetical protein